MTVEEKEAWPYVQCLVAHCPLSRRFSPLRKKVWVHTGGSDAGSQGGTKKRGPERPPLYPSSSHPYAESDVYCLCETGGNHPLPSLFGRSEPPRAPQLFRPKLVACLPVQETSIARRGPRGPHPLRGYQAYVSRYVAGSAPGPATPLGEVSWNGTSWPSSTATRLRSWTGRRRPHTAPGNLCTGSQRA